MRSSGRLAKIQATTRPHHRWPAIWSSMSKASQRKENQQWAIEKPKLDNARKSRGIYFIDPKITEFKEATKNARKKLEIAMEAAMPGKLKTTTSSYQHREIDSGANKIQKSKHACLVGAHESTRKRLERTPSKDHEEHFEEKWINSLSHYNLEHKFVPVFQAMKISDAKAAVDKGWEKLEKLPA